MKRFVITCILVLGWFAVHAQQATDPNVTAEQLAILEQLERGEQVEFSDVDTTKTAKKKKVKEAKEKEYDIYDLFAKYSSRENFTSVYFGRKMMSMLAKRMAREDRDAAGLLKDISSMRVLSTKEPSAEFERDAKTWHKTSTAELISRVEADGQVTYVYLDEPVLWNTESTFMLLSFSAEEQVVVYIKGYFSVKDISRLSSIRPK